MDDDGSGAGADGGKDEVAAGGRRKTPRRKPVDPVLEAIGLDTLLAAHHRHAVTELPRGELGTGVAVRLVGAFVEGCRRRLPDVTASGPQLMAFVVKHGLIPAMPSPRVIPAAFGLVSAVSPLLEARSERVWTAWFARVHDEGSRVAERLRRMTPASQLAVVEEPPLARPMRSAALVAERDRLAAEVVAQKVENEKLKAEVVRFSRNFEAFDAWFKDKYTARSIALAQAKAEIVVRKTPGHSEADVERARAEAGERARRELERGKDADIEL